MMILKSEQRFLEYCNDATIDGSYLQKREVMEGSKVQRLKHQAGGAVCFRHCIAHSSAAMPLVPAPNLSPDRLDSRRVQP